MTENKQEDATAQFGVGANKDAASELEFTYSSAIEIFSNGWDLRIVFGDRKPNQEVVRKGGIVMSHRHAKVLSQILAKQIEQIEKLWGPISTKGIVDSVAETPAEHNAKAAKAAQ